MQMFGLFMISTDFKNHIRHDSMFLSSCFSYRNGTHFLILHFYNIHVSSSPFVCKVLGHYLTLSLSQWLLTPESPDVLLQHTVHQTLMYYQSKSQERSFFTHIAKYLNFWIIPYRCFHSDTHGTRVQRSQWFICSTCAEAKHVVMSFGNTRNDVLQVQVLSSLSGTLVLFPENTANLHSNIQHAIKKVYKVLPCIPFESLFFISLYFPTRTHPPTLKVLFLRKGTPFHLLLLTHPPFASGGAKYSSVTMSAIKCNSHCKISAF